LLASHNMKTSVWTDVMVVNAIINVLENLAVQYIAAFG